MSSSGLRSRVVVLAAIVAIIATSLCAAFSARTLVEGLRGQREVNVLAEARHADERLGRLVQRLAFEAGDYAAWDELHQRMPRPPDDWAAVNLIPGDTPGRLAQAFVLLDRQGRITGRYRRATQRGAEPGPGDPAPAAALVALATGSAHAGVAAPAGIPLLYAAHPVLPSDQSGEPSGTLIALAYVTPELLAELDHKGYRIEIAVLPRPAAEPLVAWRDEAAVATLTRPAIDGQALAVTASEGGELRDDLVWRAVLAVGAGGLAGALIAMLLGMRLGFTWMRPLSALAEACRQRAQDPEAPIPSATGLHEAEVLREALLRMDEAVRERARRLGEALDRERTVNAVHQRFLAQLARELGDPIHTLVATIDRLAASGGRLPPEEVAAARERALELEGRLHEALGLADEPTAVAAGERELAEYLAGVADLLRPLASQRGGSVTVEATGRARLRPDLLTPVLVNLAANALRAGRGVQVRLTVRIEATETHWSVEDTGPGIEPALAQRLADACARGEVLPGTPGLGLGLAIVLANLRALGGRISLDNRPGSGVRFTFVVPVPASSSSTHLMWVPRGPVEVQPPQ